MLRIIAAAVLAGCGFSVPGVTPGGDAGNDGAVDAPPGGIPSPRKVVLDTSGLVADLSDFPALVPIAGQIDYSRVVDPRQDLRFEDPATGASLPYEVESWDPVGESLVWVLVPKLRAPPASTSLLLYFGRDAGQARPANVWPAYEQVTHFAGGAADSTGHGHDGTATNAQIVSGKLGSAMGFATNTARVTFAGTTLDQWEQGTLEMWLKPGYANGDALIGAQPRVLDNAGSLQLGRFFSDFGTLVMQIDMKWSGAQSYLHPAVPGNDWSHLAWVYDGSVLRVYRNGALVAMDPIGQHAFSNSSALVLGDSINSAKMQVDELRFSRAGLSADWIKMQHRAMSRSFVTFADP